MTKKRHKQFNDVVQKRPLVFFAFLAMLLFATGESIQAQVRKSKTNGTNIAGIESLTGCSERQVRNAKISDNTFPADDKGKIFFLYNVKTGLLLNTGGYWGTHVSLQEYGMPLWIHIDTNGWIHLAQKFDKEETEQGEGNYLEYETTGSASEDKGVYIDRAYLYHNKTIIKRGWKLEVVTGKTNTYRIYTHLNNASSPTQHANFDTTNKAKLYACLVKSDNTADTKTLHATILEQTEYMSAEEKKALHIEEQNMDYAAKEFYGSHKYFNSVLVQVPEEGGTIRFGIEIGTQDDAEPTETDREWTVFDDFRLLYTSRTIDGDLVLDQDRDNLDYLQKCSNTYQSVTLHLNKSFDKDKWNGFVLPVSLTKDQLTQAFGSNVKLAKLDKLTNTEIQFVSVDMSKAGNDDKVMQAYVPYIIFPTKHTELEQTPAYTALLSSTGNGQAKDVHVSICKNHIEIPNITFAIDEENKNDLSNMNTVNWTTNSSIVVDGSGTPFVNGNGTMTAYGTFARTFGTGTLNTDKNDDDYGKWSLENKANIIDGRSDLKGCYFFSGGMMYCSTTRPRGLRGFSVWFAPTTTPAGAPAKTANILLDGVSLDKATGISPIIYGREEQKIDRFANGIYSLSGQLIGNGSSLDSLPKGIYILNGKKVMKK